MLDSTNARQYKRQTGTNARQYKGSTVQTLDRYKRQTGTNARQKGRQNARHINEKNHLKQEY